MDAIVYNYCALKWPSQSADVFHEATNFGVTTIRFHNWSASISIQLVRKKLALRIK